jgi:diguanylate cyclase (GGDEF)-like protein
MKMEIKLRYTGRIVTIFVFSVVFITIRIIGIIYYDYPSEQIPIIGIFILLISWLLGAQYDKLKFLSEKDTLTSLYNRRYLLEAWTKAVANADRKQEKLVLYFIDVDQYKIINDTRGHEMGDQVLRQIAHALLHHSMQDDLVVRWAGDEFLIVSTHSDDQSRASMIQRIDEELEKISEQIHIKISVSIGSAMYPIDAQTLDGLLHAADQDMYAVKTTKQPYL